MRKPALMLVIVTSLIITACSADRVRYVTAPLTLPVKPVLPAVSADEIACLSDEAVWKLVERQRLRREYVEELEVIILSTQQPEKP